jgi:hypothetical protein
MYPQPRKAELSKEAYLGDMYKTLNFSLHLVSFRKYTTTEELLKISEATAIKFSNNFNCNDFTRP